ncbi:MAG: hypothetical protein M3Y49_21275 [Actinomycetota bacterium]|nr:hypothetical protein [Actinomycetota bacterium]
METYIASIVPSEVREVRDFGIRHIITNPTVVSQSGVDWRSDLADCLDLLNGDVHMQTTASDPTEILTQVEEFSAICKGRLIVKLPFTRSALRVLPDLRRANLLVDLTGIVTTAQAIAAAATGAEYLAIYVGRATRAGGDGLEVVRSISQMLSAKNCKTKVIAASINTPQDFTDAAIAGADAAACPFDLVSAVIDNDITDESVRTFAEHWRLTEGS